MKIYFNWEEFAKTISNCLYKERMITLGFLGISLSKSERALCVEFFKTKKFAFRINRWNEILCF